jgi:GTP-binding protein
MIGRDADDLVLRVPIGTVATDTETGRVLADLTKHGMKVPIARGGRGGRGNAHFATSTHQAPKYAENGEPGQAYNIKLELKLLADVGLVGFPNAGKSSLITSVSAARPKIADYPFTTLVPNLGVVKIDDSPENTLVFADIPGIIEGASDGAGLGQQFLRHVERTRVLIHVLDAGGYSGRDPLEDYEKLNHELSAYSDRLAGLKQIVAINKIDIADPDEIESLVEHFKALDIPAYPVSAATGAQTAPLLYKVAEILKSIPKETETDDDDSVLITPKNGAFAPVSQRRLSRQYTIERDPETNYLVVHGVSLERLVAMTQLNNEEAFNRFERILEKAGVIGKLKAMGAKEGDTVKIGTFEFDYIDEDAPGEH